jgi:hypothetical protein
VEHHRLDLCLPRSGARPLGPAPPGRKQRKSRRRPLAGFLACGLGLAVAAGLARDARALEGTKLAPTTDVSPESARHPRQTTFLKRQWGIEVVDLRQTAAGYMLEFRYRVLDAEKAKPLFERGTKPMLTHAETGATLIVPTPAKTGALRNSNPPIAGRTYWMFFANPGKLVRPGEHVSIEIGEFRLDGIVVH